MGHFIEGLAKSGKIAQSHAHQEYQATRGQAGAAEFHMSEVVGSHVDYHIVTYYQKENSLCDCL